MAVVKEITAGDAKVYIHDDYIRQSPEEVELIIQNASRIICNALQEKTA